MRTCFGLLLLSFGHLVPFLGQQLDFEGPVGFDGDLIVVLEQPAWINTMAFADEVVVDPGSVGRLAVPDVDHWFCALFEDDGVELHVVAGEGGTVEHIVAAK